MNIKNNKLMIVFSLIFVILFLFGSIEKAIADVDVWSIYLPLVQKSVLTTEPPPIPTPVPTDTPTAPPPVIVTTGDVQITKIFFDGVVSSYEPDEYVEIKNFDTNSIQLQNWTLRDIAEHVYTFPSFVIAPNQICRIYTNETHADFCSFNYGSSQGIWNNSGDTAYLRDSTGNLIDEYTY